MATQPVIDILLVEDNRADVRLTVEAIREADSSVNLLTARTGEEALRMLQGGETAKPISPKLVVLDLNLPGVDGRQVLREIKTDPKTRHIPVVVLTTSDNQEDLWTSYRDGANCYLTKPIDLDDFISLIRCIEELFLHRARSPWAVSH
jgi:CheY-like chemotaxis protein